MSKRDGGPAFARPAFSNEETLSLGDPGMSKREYFAGQIMAGLASQVGEHGWPYDKQGNCTVEGGAILACKAADALLEALAQGD